MPALRLLILGAIALLLGACASQPAAELQVPAGQYTTAFEAAKETLRGFDFSLERIDAYSGVISTKPKTTAGAGTPWDREQSTLGQEVEDLLNRQSRVARVTFEPAGGVPRSAAGGVPPDLRESSPPVVMRVTVQVSRRQKPGWRLETSAIRTSTRTSDPELLRAGMEPGYETPTGDDPKLAGRIAQEIAERLAAGPAMDQRTSAERRGDEAAASSSPSPSSAPAAASATSGPR